MRRMLIALILLALGSCDGVPGGFPSPALLGTKAYNGQYTLTTSIQSFGVNCLNVYEGKIVSHLDGCSGDDYLLIWHSSARMLDEETVEWVYEASLPPSTGLDVRLHFTLTMSRASDGTLVGSIAVAVVGETGDTLFGAATMTPD